MTTREWGKPVPWSSGGTIDEMFLVDAASDGPPIGHIVICPTGCGWMTVKNGSPPFHVICKICGIVIVRGPPYPR